MFLDRSDAGRQLAAALEPLRRSHPLVLAIPRGGVPVAVEVARALGGDLDLVLVRKLHAPWSDEVAVGAVDETGWAWIAPHAAASGASPEYLQREKREQLDELARRRERYAPGRPVPEVRGRVVVVVDDGLATGATMVAALHAVRSRSPARLVCAVPVASPEACRTVRPYADQLVCVLQPPDFRAVGQFYRDFPQTADEEVAALLRPFRRAA